MNQKFLNSILLILFISIPVFSQENEYSFESIIELDALPIENQYMSNTCWSFSSLSFLESEIYRLSNKKIDLSEMFIVRNVYIEKAKRYVRMHGKLQFSGGGALNDVTDIIKQYGIVPNSEYTGLMEGAKNHIHYALDSVLLDYVEKLVKLEELPNDWMNKYINLLDEYLGEVPGKFTYEGKKYTAQSFAASLDINMDDYMLFTSFTHHPFYSTFIFEVPDNWSWGQPYNLPIDEIVKIIDSSLNKGYTVAWACDISEEGFSWGKGLAIAPAKFSDKSFQVPGKELKVTQEIRQEEFDNYQTTDDHGMQIIGISKDAKGTKYFYVKNSWGTSGSYNGYVYVSETFLKYKTITMMVHKDAIPQQILKKLKK